MIYTGVTEDNTDPRHFNRIKVRVYGMHTDQEGGEMQIPTDDLPWATPLVYGAIPPIGSKVNVIKDGEMLYYVSPFPKVDMDEGDYQNGVVLLHNDNLGQSVENGKAVNTKQGQHITVKYTDSKGFQIDYQTSSGQNQITIAPDNKITIQNANGDGMTIDMSNSKMVLKANTIELDCQKLKLGSENADKKLLTEDFITLFNNHTHITPNGMSETPVIQGNASIQGTSKIDTDL